MSNVPHDEYFACDPCECGGHPDCPVCGVEAVVRDSESICGYREHNLECTLKRGHTGHHRSKQMAWFGPVEREPATDEEIERSFDAYR